jgi:hypothetical protein
MLSLRSRLKNPNRRGIAAGRAGSQEEAIEFWNKE